MSLESPVESIMEDAGQIPVCVRLEAPTNNCSLNFKIGLGLKTIQEGISS